MVRRKDFSFASGALGARVKWLRGSMSEQRKSMGEQRGSMGEHKVSI